jgi:hypothetical protein
MRIPISLAALLLAACAAVGCGKPAETTLTTASAADRDLKTTMTVDRQFARAGQDLHITLTARNTGLHTMEISARNSAPMLVTLWRYDSLKGWQRIAEYPQAAAFQLSPWKLSPFGQRTFEMTVPVDDTWPTNESIRLSAELNGRPDARAYVLVKVLGD